MRTLKKRFIFLLSTLFLSHLLNAQVGINTLVPYAKSVLHIDAGGNNTSATTVTAAQAADDIVIDNRGCIGVGVVEPTAKLHINSANSGMMPIRIADGSEGNGKYLASNATGGGSWIDKPEPNGVVYYSRTPRLFPVGRYTELPVEVNEPGYNRITIPKSGNYVTTLRWWGSANVPTPGVMVMASMNIQLCRTNGQVLDQTDYYVAASETGGSRICFTVSLFAQGVVAGEQLYLQIKPTSGTDWETARWLNPTQQTMTIYYPSVMVYNV